MTDIVNGVDIDRLRYVIKNRPNVTRGAGKTFAIIQEMVRQIEIGIERFIVIVSYYRDCPNYLHGEIFNCLRNHYIDFKFSALHNTIEGTGQYRFKIQFVTENDLEKRRGSYDNVIYMRYWD